MQKMPCGKLCWDVKTFLQTYLGCYHLILMITFYFFSSISVQENIDQVAFHTCCPVGNTWARSRCEFTAERVSFGTSVDRCLNDPEGSNSQMCDVSGRSLLCFCI